MKQRASFVVVFGSITIACSGASPGPGFGASSDGGLGSSGGGSGSGSGSGGSLGSIGTSSGGGTAADGGTTTGATTIYATTDDSLYSMNPQTHAVTLLGKFSSVTGSVTDVAVNGAGDVFVNTTSEVYKATLPSGGATSVKLTRLTSIAGGASFYALGFTPEDALGANTGEVLIGGDGAGELWSIDTGTGATKDLGSFGDDPDNPGSLMALSGDVVFYMSASGAPTGLATIRSCQSSGNCDTSNDYLAGIDMAALATAYRTGTRAASLNAGIYGGSNTSKGNGAGYGKVFGLGAWQGSVYGFSFAGSGSPPELLSFDTSNGSGTSLSTHFSFTNGWTGAGVTSKVTVNVPPPPPPPK